MLIVNKHILACKPLLAKDDIIVYVSNYYRSIKDLIALNVKSIDKYFLYFVPLLSIIAIEL
jgi:hypothetical protein